MAQAALSCFFVLFLVGLGFVSATTYSISPRPLGRTYYGHGGCSGGGATSRFLPDYSPQQRDEILDFLFLPRFGASLPILKVEIGGDGQSTQGTEASHMHVADEAQANYHRGYEWQLMHEAKQRNPAIKLFGLSWTFPHWVMEGGSSNNPFTNSTARYVTNWLVAARDVHGLHVDYVGLWNEKPHSVEYIITLAEHLRAANLSTQIIAADGCCGYTWTICDDLQRNPQLSDVVLAVGAHYPAETAPPQCQSLQQPLWATEDFSSYFQAGGCWARLLNRNYVRHHNRDNAHRPHCITAKRNRLVDSFH